MRRLVGTALVVLAVTAGAGCATGDQGAAPGGVAPDAGAVTPTTVTPSTVTPTTVAATVTPATVAPATVTPAIVAPTTTSPVAVTTVPAPVVRSGANASPDQPVGEPLSISIPDIGVQSTLVATGVLDDGTVAVPEDPSIAGWFTGGPRPGERGPALIMGHYDSRAAGPGVFYRLADLPIGALVTVETTAGPQHFVVQTVEQYPKDQFPTELVYGAEPGATLRLVTCGGSFDQSIRHYRDNIVAFLVRTDI